MLSPDRLVIAPAVADALHDGRPVVALESTLISHGLPYPQNVEVAMASEQAVRDGGAEAATVAVHDGKLLVGLTPEELDVLGSSPGEVRKVSRASLAVAIASGGWGGTTVAATMIAAHAAGIRVFSTGGIGGVHRGALSSVPGGRAPSLDISADLDELARTPLAVVCAGPKAILDVPLTLEYLETRGVPLVAVGIDQVPGFYSRRSGIRAPISVPDIAAAADVVRTHEELGLGSGLVICTPVPEADALPDEVSRDAVERAVREAEHTGVSGSALTPWLLARVASITEGASVRANIALIVNNARSGGELAAALAPILVSSKAVSKASSKAGSKAGSRTGSKTGRAAPRQTRRTAEGTASTKRTRRTASSTRSKT